MIQYGDEFSIQVTPSDAGKRLDTVIAYHIPECSRAYASYLINQGSIQVQGSRKKPSYRVKTSELITAVVPPPKAVSFNPEPLDLDIVYEDKDLIIINKPPGMVVHPAPGHESGTLVNGLLYRCPDLKGISGEIRPGIVHRLDKDTSGVIVVAKHSTALHHLAHQFKTRKVKKTYLAIIHGTMASETGKIILPIGRHPVDRKKMSVANENRRKQREAETLWSVKESFELATLLQVNPLTGRTHQIIGDSVYGSRKAWKNTTSKHPHHHALQSVKRQMLHAWKIQFIHPGTQQQMTFEAPIPRDMVDLLKSMRKE
jgi:23S rRNA pseudouridine1911/1915/1917 synthase